MGNSDLRDHILWLLRGGHAHIGFDDAIADLPVELRGQTPPGLPHSPWRLVEHIRIAQWDILEFSRRADHVSPDFPEGYWPQGDAPSDADAWDASVTAFQQDAEQMQALIADPQNDLLAPFPWGSGQTLLREALLIADHNAYHIGQLVAVRRALGVWPG
ncbi:MAG: DinB family protein [Rhodospirillales bacterium]|nr:DinB family protein [Rhodospirillales bacterium]